MRLAQRQRCQAALNVQFLNFPGERIPLEEGSVDTVVSTFTLCTIPVVVEPIRGIVRVLRPGGRLIFFEHGRSPDPSVRRWQDRWEPIHHCVFQGRHRTREIPFLLKQGGLEIEQMKMAYLVPFPKAVDLLVVGDSDSAPTAIVPRYVSTPFVSRLGRVLRPQANTRVAGATAVVLDTGVFRRPWRCTSKSRQFLRVRVLDTPRATAAHAVLRVTRRRRDERFRPARRLTRFRRASALVRQALAEVAARCFILGVQRDLWMAGAVAIAVLHKIRRYGVKPGRESLRGIELLERF